MAPQKQMKQFIFYTKKYDYYELSKVNTKPNIMYDWYQDEYEKSRYVMKNAIDIKIETSRLYEDMSIMIIIKGLMTEKDYIYYKLKY